MNVMNSSICFKLISVVTNGESRWWISAKTSSKLSLPFFDAFVLPLRLNDKFSFFKTLSYACHHLGALDVEKNYMKPKKVSTFWGQRV